MFVMSWYFFSLFISSGFLLTPFSPERTRVHGILGGVQQFLFLERMTFVIKAMLLQRGFGHRHTRPKHQRQKCRREGSAGNESLSTFDACAKVPASRVAANCLSLRGKDGHAENRSKRPMNQGRGRHNRFERQPSRVCRMLLCLWMSTLLISTAPRPGAC